MNIKKLINSLYFLIIFFAVMELFKYRGVIGDYFFLDLRIYIALFFAIILFLLFFSNKKFKQILYLKKFNNQYLLPIVLTLTIILFGIDIVTYPTFVNNNFGINQAVLLDLLILSYFFKIITSSWKTIKKQWAKLFFFAFLLLCFYIYTYNSDVFIKLAGNFSGKDDDNLMEWFQVFILSIGSIFSLLLAVMKNRQQRKINFCLRLVYIALIFVFIFLIGEEISWGQRLFNIQVEKGSSYQEELNIHNNEGANEIFIFLYIFAFLYGFISWRIGQYLKKRKATKNPQTLAWRNLFCFRGQEVLYLLPTFIFNPYADRSLFTNKGPSLLDLYHDLGIVPDFFAALRFLVIWRESFEALFYLALVIHVFNLYLDQQKKYIYSKKINNIYVLVFNIYNYVLNKKI